MKAIVLEGKISVHSQLTDKSPVLAEYILPGGISFGWLAIVYSIYNAFIKFRR